MEGSLIVLEGVDGVGKTTQCKKLLEYFTNKGRQAIYVREPGGLPVSEAIRRVLLSTQYEITSVLTELYLFSASRTELVNSVILPAINAGKIVICDRFIYSTIAYQGYAGGISVPFVKSVCNYSITPFGNLKKKLLFPIFLDLSPEEAFKRKNGADSGDRIEQRDLDYFMRVYRGYKLQHLPTVDAHGTEEEVFNLILAKLKEEGFSND